MGISGEAGFDLQLRRDLRSRRRLGSSFSKERRISRHRASPRSGSAGTLSHHRSLDLTRSPANIQTGPSRRIFRSRPAVREPYGNRNSARRLFRSWRAAKTTPRIAICCVCVETQLATSHRCPKSQELKAKSPMSGAPGSRRPLALTWEMARVELRKAIKSSKGNWRSCYCDTGFLCHSASTAGGRDFSRLRNVTAFHILSSDTVLSCLH